MTAAARAATAALVLTLGAGAWPACAGRVDGPEVESLAQSPPVLPALVGQVYATGSGAPADVVVALAARDLPLDEALSGGAAALALDGATDLTLLGARWAAWRAGYPFAVRAAVSGTSTAPVPPAEVVQGLNEVLQAGDQVGLARARSGDVDTWVALVAHPLAGVPAFARQHQVGDTLSLELPAGTAWRLVSPEGVQAEGQGAVAARLQVQGEWWLEASLPGGLLSVPIYAGLDMPAAPLLELPGPAAEGPGHAAEQAIAAIAQVRQAFDLPALETDPTLQTLALTPLEEVVAGTWQRQAAVERLRGAGFVGSSADQAWCQARTAALCVEGLMHTAAGRSALLDPRHRLVGVAARVESRGLTFVVALAGE